MGMVRTLEGLVAAFALVACLGSGVLAYQAAQDDRPVAAAARGAGTLVWGGAAALAVARARREPY